MSVPVLSSRDRARQARRGAILEAAEAVFSERGYAGATMAEIAARSGYSAGNLYNLFESKEDLFSEVLNTTGALLVTRIASVHAAELSFAELLPRILREIFAFVEEHRGFIAIYLEVTLATHWDPDRFGERFVAVRTALEDELEKILGPAIARGEAPPIAATVASAIVIGAIHRYVARWVQENRSSEELWRDAAELCRALCAALRIEPLPQIETILKPTQSSVRRSVLESVKNSVEQSR